MFHELTSNHSLATNYKIIVFVKAKKTHDFRWESPTEAKTLSYQNIIMNFKHSLPFVLVVLKCHIAIMTF